MILKNTWWIGNIGPLSELSFLLKRIEMHLMHCISALIQSQSQMSAIQRSSLCENDVLVNPCFSLSLSSSQTPVADGREKQAKKRYDEQLLYLCYRNGRHQGTVNLYEACVNHTTVPTGLETVRVRWAKTLWVWPFSGHMIGGPCQCWWEPITDESCPCPFSSCFRLTHWYVS